MPSGDFAHGFLGRGEATITVPSFDGALKPNQALEEAETLFDCAAPEDLAADGSNVYLADGNSLARIEAECRDNDSRFRTNRSPQSAACPAAASLSRSTVGKCMSMPIPRRQSRVLRLQAPACAASMRSRLPAPDALFATDGSSTRSVQEWAWDLMEGGRSGRALRLDLKSSEIATVAQGLRYAFGVCAMGDAALVSESWRHRLVAVVTEREATRISLTHLPVYPSRLTPASDGGWWLTAFTARTQLVEFVLRETAYRKRMMAEIDPEYWIVPRLSSGGSFKEPMQGAHLKTMGVVKPWAPPRSYGLVIRLDAT